MRKLVSLLLITLIFAAFTVPAAAVNMSLVIASAPTRYTFEGANLSNSTRTDLSFDLTTLPLAAEISSASLKYTQEGISGGILYIINKQDSDILDTKSLNSAGDISVAGLRALVDSWRLTPSLNQGFTLQAATLGGNDTVLLKNINLEIAYILNDKEAPGLLNVIVDGVTESTATVFWESSEPSTAGLKYGKTSNYGSEAKGTETADIAGSITLTGLNPGVTYHLQLEIKDEGGNKTVSGDKTFVTSLKGKQVLGENTVDPSKIAPPKLLSLEINKNSPVREVSIAWQAAREQDIDGYIVLRSREGFDAYQEIRRVDTLTFFFSDKDIEPENTYYYTVRAFKGQENSINSEELAISVPSVIDSNIRVTPAQPNPLTNTILALLAVSGFTLLILYLVAKLIAGMLRRKGKKKKKSKNILHDPDFYWDKES